MRRIVAGMQISIDAKIEGPAGHADWVADWGDTFGLLPEIDTCVLGARMYPGYEAYWDDIARDASQPLQLTGKLPTAEEVEYARFAVTTPHYVLAHTAGDARWSRTRFIQSLQPIEQLRQAPGKTIYVVGGAQTVTRMLDAGLIDELRLTIHPLVAGEGLALFGTVSRRHTVELLSATPQNGGKVSLRYSVRHD